jgi:hypothetical protein
MFRSIVNEDKIDQISAFLGINNFDAFALTETWITSNVSVQGPVVQKPINANLGLNLLKLGLNFNPRLLCVVQS